MFTTVPRLALIVGIGAGFAAAAAISACSRQNISAASIAAQAAALESAQRVADPAMVDLADRDSLDRLLSDLEAKRVVFVGETHDRYDHHRNQLAVIRGLRERDVDLAVGVEFFQEPFQQHLDDYVAGRIDEKTLLKRTQYYERWKYDYRLYRDILTYARDKDIPLIALNAPKELVSRVSRSGLGDLEPEDWRGSPGDTATAGTDYRARLRPVFEMHGKMSEKAFRRFVDVQLLWDEHMARVARDYLIANPNKTMVLLAGSGHVVYPDAIPGRLARMLDGDQSVVATGAGERYADGAVDYVFKERKIALDPPGKMGMRLASDAAGVSIREIPPAGAAVKAGFRAGDQILSIAGEPIRGMDDVRLALLDRVSGEEVWIEVEPNGLSERGARQGRVLRLL